ncbi:hypothetical protein, partial [Streptomyces sp. V2]|uniref:hypothetical protein n=1 Tax=Streptomyces sp. V2 TaxID=1424099 RepID=UPI0019D2749E
VNDTRQRDVRVGKLTTASGEGEHNSDTYPSNTVGAPAWDKFNGAAVEYLQERLSEMGIFFF